MRSSVWCDEISHRPAPSRPGRASPLRPVHPSCARYPPVSHSAAVSVVRSTAVVLRSLRSGCPRCQKVESSLTLGRHAYTVRLAPPGPGQRRLTSSRGGACSTMRDFERRHVHRSPISACCYKCSVLLLRIVVKLLLCLIYELNLITGIYVSEKHRIYSGQDYPRFRAPLGSQNVPGPPADKGGRLCQYPPSPTMRKLCRCLPESSVMQASSCGETAWASFIPSFIQQSQPTALCGPGGPKFLLCQVPGLRGELDKKRDPHGEERAVRGTRKLLPGQGGIREGFPEEGVTFSQGLEAGAGV